MVSLKGFSLVELLVVLTIIAAIGSLIGPDFWQSYQRANERLVVVEFLRELNDMRRELVQSAGAVYIATDALSVGEAPPEFPPLSTGWAIVSNSELAFLPTGVTSGGQVELESPTGHKWRLTLEALDGTAGIERM